MAQEINIKLNVETGGANQTVGQLKTNIEQVGAAADKTSQKTSKMNSSLSSTSKSIKSLGLEDASRGIERLGTGFSSLRLSNITSGFRMLGAAIASNPIGAIATAVLALINAFGGLQKVMDFLLAPLKGLFSAFRMGGNDVDYAAQRITEFNAKLEESRFIYDKNIIGLENTLKLMREQGKTASELAEQERKIAVEKQNYLWKYRDALEEEIKSQNIILEAGAINGRKLTEKQIDDYNKEIKKLTIERNRTLLEIEKTTGDINVAETRKANAEKVKVEKKTTKETTEVKKEASKDDLNLIKERLKKEEELILQNKQLQINALTEEFIAGKMSYETLQAEKVLIEKQTNEELIKFRQDFRINDAEKLRVGLKNAAVYAETLEEENQKKILDLTAKNLEIDANLKKKYDDDEKKREEEDRKNREKLREEELENEKRLADETAEYKKQKREEELQAQKELQDASFALASASLSSLSTLNDIFFQNKRDKVEKGSKEEEKLARKQFEINKALQLGTAVINGIQSILAITSVPDFTLGIQSALRIGAQVALNAASIAKIASQKFSFNGGGAAGGSTTPTLPSAPTAQAPTFQPTQFFGLGQTTPGLGGQAQGPTRVYVTEGDISNTQNRVRVVENRARFG